LQALGLSWPEVLAQLGVESNGEKPIAPVTTVQPTPVKPANPPIANE
jgi:hypothetical protein